MYNTNVPFDALRQSLVEWHEFSFPALVPRGFNGRILEGRRLLSIIGPRRAGKTFACFEIIGDLLKQGVPRKNIIYMNFEDERLVPLSGAELTNLLDVHEELFEREKNQPCYCFLDEIHNVPHWSKWVRRVVDQHTGLTVVITGSSSKMLSSEIATELRGRGTSVTVFPYSFTEFLRASGHDAVFSDALLFSPRRIAIKRCFNDYLLRGGFPGVVGEAEYRDTLQLYYRAMFARDMVERYAIKNVRLFEDFLKILITRFAALTSISNIEKVLRGLGYGVSKNTLTTYFGYARDAFLLFDVCKFDHKVTNQLRASRKLYAVDHGLINAVRFSSPDDQGRILENMAFMELKRRGADVFYHAGRAECDFVIMNDRTVSQCIQICWSIHRNEVLERELRGMIDALVTYRLDTGLILTRDDTADIERDGKKIAVRPFWYFALKPE